MEARRRCNRGLPASAHAVRDAIDPASAGAVGEHYQPFTRIALMLYGRTHGPIIISSDHRGLLAVGDGCRLRPRPGIAQFVIGWQLAQAQQLVVIADERAARVRPARRPGAGGGDGRGEGRVRDETGRRAVRDDPRRGWHRQGPVAWARGTRWSVASLLSRTPRTGAYPFLVPSSTGWSAGPASFQ